MFMWVEFTKIEPGASIKIYEDLERHGIHVIECDREDAIAYRDGFTPQEIASVLAKCEKHGKFKAVIKYEGG